MCERLLILVCLVKEKNNVKCLLASLKILTHFEDCFESHIRVSVLAFFRDFRKYFYSHSRNKLPEDGYWKDFQNKQVNVQKKAELLL
jgi:hypothetical protein